MDHQAEPPASSGQHEEPPFRYMHSVSLPGLLDRLESTLVVTTYHDDRLLDAKRREAIDLL